MLTDKYELQLFWINKKKKKPNNVAKQYLNIVIQPKSVWTHELDLKPSSENF